VPTSSRRQRLERERQVSGRLKPLRRLLVEAAPDDAIKCRGHVGRKQLGRVGLEDRGHGFDRGVACEGAAAESIS